MADDGEKQPAKTARPEAEPRPPARGPSRVARALRSVVVALLLVGLLAGFVGTLFFLYQRSKGEPPVEKTEQPAVNDIVKKAVATGSIVPRREVPIKPRVSGIVRKLHVEPGQVVEVGDLIAEVTIVPDVVALTRAEGQVRSAAIAVTHASLELERAKRLQASGVASTKDVADRQLDYDIKIAEQTAAAEMLQVVREGAIAKGAANAKKGRADTGPDGDNTKIRATVRGTVLDVPVLEGASVIEANNFNEGTTVASIADMDDMIFLGKVDEADVGKIKLGLDVSIQIGAIEGKSFDGTLEFIASKGKLVDGAIQFEVKAALKPVKDTVIRAGYSANAGIVLEKKSQVLSLNEKLVQFDGKQPFVEIQIAPNRFERRDVSLGISDGIQIEVKSGVELEDKIKVPQAVSKSKT